MTRKPKYTAARIRAARKRGMTPEQITATLGAPPSIVARTLSSTGKRGQPRKHAPDAVRLDGVYLPAEIATRARAMAKSERVAFAALIVELVRCGVNARA